MQPLFTAHGDDVFGYLSGENRDQKSQYVGKCSDVWHIIIKRNSNFSNICHTIQENKNFWEGIFQFVFLDSQESKTGIAGAVQDENTCVFLKKQQEEFEKVKDTIEDLANQARTASDISENSYSVVDEIEKFFVLKEKGVITEEEFQAKKKELLG